MANNLQNVVVFIKDEAELEEAREMLVANGEKIANDGTFFLSRWYHKENFLQRFENDGSWWVSFRFNHDLITLTELEKLLKTVERK